MVLGRGRLDEIYEVWNRAEFIAPDPLEMVVVYGNVRDREVVALLAALLAYGRVSAILGCLRRVLGVMGVSPFDYVVNGDDGRMGKDFDGFVYRFARAEHVLALLRGMRRVLREYGSLERVFCGGNRGNLVSRGNAPALLGALQDLFVELGGDDGRFGHLFPRPDAGSACKRLMLFLRWMVRSDGVDPGGWSGVRPAELLMPLDTWIFRIARRAGWTQRKSVDFKTVLELGSALAEINPEDPVRYDFALSRFGIRESMDLDMLFEN